MVNKGLAIEVLNTLTETGADFAELFYEDTYSKNFQFEGSKVDEMTQDNINGVGLRLFKDLRSVYGYTNDLSKKGLLSLAHNLASSLDGKRVIDKVSSFSKVKIKKVNKPVDLLKDVPNEEIIEYVRKGVNKITSYDPRIVRVIAGFSIKDTSTVIYNTKGQVINNFKEYGRVFFNSISSENGNIQSTFDGPGSQNGWKFFKEEIDIEALALKNASANIKMLNAKECPAGKFPVVIANGWGGVIFHEACGHQLEATSVAKGLSVFSGKMGEMIANPIVSAYDDGRIPNVWGSIDVDDEGVASTNNCLIKNGKLVGYMVDSFNARRMGCEPTGCARRQSYKFEPTSRMTNTYIAAGKSTPEEIIANTKLGIYAANFGGGSVDPSTGDFNFGCTEAYLIKDGKIDQPLRGATLVGNAREILKHIDMVGNDVAFGVGMCGSSSGSIPVQVGQPTIRLDEITVGGRGGSIDEFK